MSIAKQTGSKRAFIHASLAAAALLAAAAGPASAGVVYTWNAFPAAGSASWSDGTQWTASGGTANADNYPGGDATVLDDAALINPTVGGYGAFTIDYSGMNAATISTLTIQGPATSASPAPVAGDVITFDATAPLTTTGAIILTASNTTVGTIVFNANSTNISTAAVTTTGAVTLNVNGTSDFTSTGAFGGNSSAISFDIASGASATFGGMSAGSGNSVISGTINGNLTTTSYTTNGSADSGNLTINASAGTVNLGNVSIQRSSGTTTSTSAKGIHILGGAVTMNNVQIGVSNSAAAMVVSAGSLTIGGTFNEGQNTGGRTSVVYVAGGTLLDTNAAGLVVGGSANTTTGGGTGAFYVTSGTATLNQITLAPAQASTAAAPGTNSGTLTVSGGTLYLGSGGISATTSAAVASTSLATTYAIALSGGTVGATAGWSSNANMTIASTNGGVAFQAADASANPFNITLAGNLSGNGSLSKTGGGALTLDGTASYTGATTVNAGDLLVNGAITASSATVVSGAMLGGVGSITPAVINNGTINPGTTGAGSIGSLSFGNGITFGDNATYAVDLNATSSDKLLVTGSIALGNNDTLELNALDSTSSGSFIIATYTGTESGTFANLPANVSVDYTTGNAITVTLGSTVPEPASLALLALGGAALLTRRRKI